MGTEDSVFHPPRSRPGKTSPHFRPDMATHLTTQMMAPVGIHSYHSLFVATSEVPRHVFTFRWWEDEATTVLWAFNIPEICMVIRYALFWDENLPRSALLSRNYETVDSFLFALSDPREHQYLSALSHLQRVEEVLRRSRIPVVKPIAWSWFPPRELMDPRIVASAIDIESHCQFMRMEFEEIVRAALGYPAPSVEWFLQQHTSLYVHLLDHLKVYPEQISVYLDVEKVCVCFLFSVFHQALLKLKLYSVVFTRTKSFCLPCCGAMFAYPSTGDSIQCSHTEYTRLRVHCWPNPEYVQRSPS